MDLTANCEMEWSKVPADASMVRFSEGVLVQSNSRTFSKIFALYSKQQNFHALWVLSIVASTSSERSHPDLPTVVVVDVGIFKAHPYNNISRNLKFLNSMVAFI